jgi:predicted enzyme related to lactoylglutathione lyase
MRVTILVRDQEEALTWYIEKLGFEKRADQMFGPDMRWLTVAPKEQTDLEILLQKPVVALHGESGVQELLERVGENTTWVLQTDDCRNTFEELEARGVHFTSEPEVMPWGISAVFEDLYGNPFNLLEPR